MRESTATLMAENRIERGSMGIFDKPVQADGKLKDLEGFTFLLKDAKVRSGINTQYGVKDAVDLIVGIDGKEYVYSGFSAGIIAQVRNADDADFPLYATIEKIAVKNGTTLNLVPMQEGEGTPVEAPPPTELFPPDAGDDDIPF